MVIVGFFRDQLLLIYRSDYMKIQSREELIYDLIFSEDTDYVIDIGGMISDVHKYDEFIDEIKEVLKKSKVFVVNSSVIVDMKTATWKLKVKK